MAASPKKRSKKYTKKAVHIPMLKDMRNSIAFKMHAAVASLQLEPSATYANEVSRQLAIMTGAIDYQSNIRISDRDEPACKAIVSALAAMESVGKRYDEKKAWGLSGDEITTLKQAAARFDEVLKAIPADVYIASERFVNEVLDDHFHDRA